MPAAPHGHLEVTLAGEAKRGDDVGRVVAAGKAAGVPVDGAVPDLPYLVVARVAGAHNRS